jgi:hypothetical protein
MLGGTQTGYRIAQEEVDRVVHDGFGTEPN